MTNREFYEAVIKAVENEELKNFAKEAIEKLNHRNESRANKPNKTQIANEPIKMAILDALTTEPTTASVIAERVEISTQKASALCRQLVADGKATVTEVKVAKKGIQKVMRKHNGKTGRKTRFFSQKKLRR